MAAKLMRFPQFPRLYHESIEQARLDRRAARVENLLERRRRGEEHSAHGVRWPQVPAQPGRCRRVLEWAFGLGFMLLGGASTPGRASR